MAMKRGALNIIPKQSTKVPNGEHHMTVVQKKAAFATLKNQNNAEFVLWLQ